MLEPIGRFDWQTVEGCRQALAAVASPQDAQRFLKIAHVWDSGKVVLGSDEWLTSPWCPPMTDEWRQRYRDRGLRAAERLDVAG